MDMYKRSDQQLGAAHFERRRTVPTTLGTRLAAAVLIVATAALILPPSTASAAGTVFDHLKRRLVSDSIAPEVVHSAYTKSVLPQFKTVASTMRIRESRLNYGQFLKPKPVASADRFINEHRLVLRQAETTYGVDPYVIAGILLVESRFGHYTGKTPVLAVLSTFALMDQAVYRDIVWRRLPTKDQKRWGRERFDSKLVARSQWAYGELLALLKWTENTPARTSGLRGSIMGAMGWPQFLPSSAVKYGIDGNGDGTVDLFDAEDSIHSIAHYLKAYGWTPEGDTESREEVLYQYNRSRPYIRTILELSRRLRKLDDSDLLS